MPDATRRLAFVCHPYHRGGVTRWMVDAASEWVGRGHECWFVTPRPRQSFASGAGRPELVAMVEALPRHRQPTLMTPDAGPEFEFGTERYRARVYARAVVQRVPEGTPVVVSDDSAAWEALALLRGRNPMIGVLHADESHYYGLASRFQYAASAIVSVSQRIFTQARASARVSEALMDVIPCGIPLPPRPSSVPRASTHLRLIWVGRINENQKRVSDLAAIAAALRAAGRAFRLDIIGDGEDVVPLRTLLERAGVADAVRFFGWLPASAVQSALGDSDLMLLPSNFEGMPVAAMEALASGCAVVGSDTCGLQEYRGRESARDALWIYPRGDVGAAVGAIEAASRVERDHRQRSARRFAEEEFAIAVCMRRYENLLSRLPRAGHVATVIPARHVGDIASWLVSRARLLRKRAKGLIAIGRQPARSAVSAIG